MQTLSVDRLVGQTLGSYRVERLLGQGRLSAVYFAQNTLTSINGALTLFIVPERFSLDARARFIQRFHKEAAALTALQNQHILPVHEYGEHQGYPYLVTPYMTNGSLADIIKREGHCEYTEALDILEQVVAGLEYAHRKGVIHGTLKPSNIVLGDDQTMLVAGFGLMHMLQMRGVEPDNRSYGHFLSIADTFLAAPEYIAPEIVQGQFIDKRSDIYALGIILFELLCGKPPFTGQKPLDVAKMHVEQSIPSLRTLDPNIPMAVISVINQALDRDPARRFQSASELAEAFAQAVAGASGGSTQLLDQKQHITSRNEDSLPETPPQGYSTNNWQLMPPIVTGKLASLNARPARKPAAPSPARPSIKNEQTWQFSSSLDVQNAPTREGNAKKMQGTSRGYQQEQPMAAPSVKPRVIAPPTFVPPTPEHVAQRLADSMPPMEPYAQTYSAPAPPMEPPVQRYAAPMPPMEPVMRENRAEEKRREWWEQTPQQNTFGEANPWGDAPAWSQPASKGKRSGSSNRRSNSSNRRSNSSNLRGSSKPPMGRRKVVALLAAGGVVAAGVVVGVKLDLNSHAANTTAATHPTGTTAAAKTGNTTNNQPAAKTGNTTNNQPAKTNGTTAANQPQATHTGTVIGTSLMAPNTSVVFNNNQDLLIHLPSGEFVAYNRVCTHQQVLINYDPASHHMICPLHGSIYDPANNAKVLLGPATLPVSKVNINVNHDGTITKV